MSWWRDCWFHLDVAVFRAAQNLALKYETYTARPRYGQQSLRGISSKGNIFWGTITHLPRNYISTRETFHLRGTLVMEHSLFCLSRYHCIVDRQALLIIWVWLRTSAVAYLWFRHTNFQFVRHKCTVQYYCTTLLASQLVSLTTRSPFNKREIPIYSQYNLNVTFCCMVQKCRSKTRYIYDWALSGCGVYLLSWCMKWERFFRATHSGLWENCCSLCIWSILITVGYV